MFYVHFTFSSCHNKLLSTVVNLYKTKMAEDKLSKTFLCQRLFSLDDEGTSDRDKAEQLRHIMLFYDGLVDKHEITKEAYNLLSSRLLADYSALVDSTNPEQGLKNYEDMIGSTQNEDCQRWKSQLTTFIDRIPSTTRTYSGQNVVARINFSKLQKNKSQKKNQQEQAAHETRASTSGLHTIISGNTHTSSGKHIPVFGKRKMIQSALSSGPENNPPRSERKDETRTTRRNIVYGAEKTDNNEVEDNPFKTAGEQLIVQQSNNRISTNDYGSKKRSLGTRRTNTNGRFIPPISRSEDNTNQRQSYNDTKHAKSDAKYEQFEWMKNIDTKMIELIENEIMDNDTKIEWNDIAGLEYAKSTIEEIVIWPMLRPDIFTGLRGPPKGLLLFGPPGTGKTLIGKCIASQSNATFFSISASSLTSKWVGEGEKMVRALFGVARCHQPAVIFIDEIDSLLTSRSESEHESSRRLKTEFLVQLDGATCTSNERLLVVGATNRPQELDEAARRRLVKRLYIPLPESNARKQIVVNLMKNQNKISEKDLEIIAQKTDGFSGADMATLCREAALGPIRMISDIRNISAEEVRPININDFDAALHHVRPSVSKSDLQVYVDWNKSYGSGGGEPG